MKQIISLAAMIVLIGNALCGMEAQKTGELASNLSTLPKELRQHIVSLFLQCHLGSSKYEWIKQIHVGGSLCSVAFSPDGKTILTVSLSFGKDSAAQLWDVATGKEMQRLVGNTRWINSVACSPDGQTILTGSCDKTARLWDLETGQELKKFNHTDSFRSVSFSPDGKTALALTAGNGTTVRLWDVVSGKVLQQFVGHTRYISSVAFSPDGKTVLTGSHDHTARLWDVDTGQEIQQFNGHRLGISSVAFSPDGKTILTGSEDGTARLWDVETGVEIRQFTEFFSIYSVAFSPDGKTILTGSDDKACLWDVRTGGKIDRFTSRYSCSFRSVAFNKYGVIALGTGSETVSLWRLRFTLPLPLTPKQKEEAYALFKNNALYAVLRDEPFVIEEQKSFDESCLTSGFYDSYPRESEAPWSDKAISIGKIGVCVFSFALYVLLKNK